MFTASDQDSQTTLTYNLRAPSDIRNIFTVNPTTGRVQNITQLDYETLTSPKLTFDVVASDGKFEGSTQVTVHVTNVNDNRPRFVKIFHNITVPETTPVDQFILHLQAFDLDELVQQKQQQPQSLTMRIISGNAGTSFRIDNTGNLYLNKKLDYRTQSSFQLTIDVTDDGELNAEQKAIVLIRVANTNNHPPVFVNKTAGVSIDEYTDNIAVYKASATDLDNLNAIIYSIHSGGFGYFDIDSNDGQVTLIKALDHKIIAQYKLTIIASDGFLQDQMILTVNVSDVNERPVVSQTEYEISVNDATPVGTSLLYVHASDPDSGNNGLLSYRLTTDDSEGVFAVNVNSGRLTLAKELDHHKNSTFSLKITVSDRGSPSLSSEKQITINIHVFIEKLVVPSFKKVQYTVDVNENEALQFATDSIIPNIHQTVIYTMEEEPQNSKTYLEIDSKTGVVRNKMTLDYEDVQKVCASIFVADTKTPGLKGHAMLTVNILSRNEFEPTLLKKTANVTVAENTSLGTILIDFEGYATDQDLEPHHQNITYRIIRGDGTFIISRGTNLVLNKPIDYETKRNYYVEVQAFDNGLPLPLSSKDLIQVSIIVSNLNEFAPEFSDTTQRTITISENENIDLTFKATDDDEQDLITYSIDANSQNLFEINVETGVLRNTGIMDYEKQRRHVIEVIAIDSGSRSSSQLITINLVDVNDNTPELSHTSYDVSIFETTPVNLTIVTISAYDKDSTAPNNEFTFSLSTGNDNFQIDARSGGISLRKPIDFESKLRINNVFDLTVTVTDLGVPARSNQSKVRVSIIDINDNVPAFNNSKIEVYFNETDETGLFVANVTATDNDFGDKIVYSIDEGSDYFTIDRHTGTITNLKPIDFEVSSERVFELFVRATDNADSFSNTMVRVLIKDKNDNRPKLEETSYDVMFPMSSEFVVRILASDPDDGDNGRLSFEFGGPSDGFAIDSTGLITVTNASSFKDIPTAKLIVRVRDNGYPRHLYADKDAEVLITIIDRQEPFLQSASPIKVNLQENTTAGAYVTTVKAIISNGHGSVNYILDDTIESKIFKIDIFTGEITTIKNLDRTKESVHKFPIIMQNSLQREKKNFVNVIVNVTDINDNRPIFETKSKDIFVEESTGIDRLIAVVRATDKDSDENSRITYVIEDGNDGDKFKIDEYGAIRLKNTLKFSEKNFYSLNIRARDNADQPKFSDILTLRITVKETPKIQENGNNKVDIPVSSDLLQGQFKEYNIELQPDNPGDEDCKIYSIFLIFKFF